MADGEGDQLRSRIVALALPCTGKFDRKNRIDSAASSE